jgi:hypothetical protein
VDAEGDAGEEIVDFGCYGRAPVLVCFPALGFAEDEVFEGGEGVDVGVQEGSRSETGGPRACWFVYLNGGRAIAEGGGGDDRFGRTQPIAVSI